jgi:predicted dehydrogenase
MVKKYKVGIIGCGDYTRRQTKIIRRGKRLEIIKAWDPNAAMLEKYTDGLAVPPAGSADEIYGDPAIDVVMLFVPPFARRGEIQKAVAAGKHIITTKPLAPNLKDATAIYRAVKNKVACLVTYGRTYDPALPLLKKIFDSGRIGRLALYKQDCIHHYPQWNTWATDPKKNGGPFMDAMIHNLNIARYLMGREADALTFFSDNHAQSLKCNDTEYLRLDFGKNRTAHLFISWAANTRVLGTTSSTEREFIESRHMVTDQGWLVAIERRGDKKIIRAVNGNAIKTWETAAIIETPYDRFVKALEQGREQICSIKDAWTDVMLLDLAAGNPGRKCTRINYNPLKK